MIRTAVFLAGSILILVLSRNALRSPRSHGFYRYFAFEAMLALFLINVPVWFSDPFSPLQVLSWIFLLISLYLVIEGGRLLISRGKPTAARQDPTLFNFEKTAHLVTTGAYRYIRHPLYGSLLFLIWGMFLKDPSWAGIMLAGASSWFLTLTARADERECISYFGKEYEDYMKRTKMFVPFFL